MRIKAELTFPPNLKDEAIICTLCKRFDIVLNILEASFSTDTGWAILIFDGKQQELERALQYLNDWNIKIEEIQRTP